MGAPKASAGKKEVEEVNGGGVELAAWKLPPGEGDSGGVRGGVRVGVRDSFRTAGLLRPEDNPVTVI